MLVTSSFLMMEHLTNGMSTNMNGATEGSTYALGLFSGARPTKAQLQNLCVNDGGTYKNVCYYRTLNTLNTLLTALAGKIVIDMVNQNISIRLNLTPDRLLIPFSELADKVNSLQDDAPTWGLLMLHSAAASASITNWVSRAMIYFTVGDQNSNADMKIQGGFIPKGQSWKPNDMALNISGNVL